MAGAGSLVLRAALNHDGAGVERSRSAVGSSWSGGVELAVGTGIAYFLAGRLGLLLRAESDMAVFWPASGIAVGALLALGPRVRLPLAVSVFPGAIASSVSIGRNLGLSWAFGALATGQALLVWLLVALLPLARCLPSLLPNRQRPLCTCGSFGLCRPHWAL